MRDHRDEPTGEVPPAGEVWQVLEGSVDDPGLIRLRHADGDRHTWDDGLEFFEASEVIPPDL